MWSLNKILFSQKLLLLIIFINHSDLQPPLDSFIISNMRTYRQHWPLEPDGTVTINKTRYTIEKYLFKKIRHVFDCYIVRYRSHFVLLEFKRLLVVLGVDSKTIQSNQPTLIPTKLLEKHDCSGFDYSLSRLSFDIFVAIDSNGTDHLIGLHPATNFHNIDDFFYSCEPTYLVTRFANSGDPYLQANYSRLLNCFQIFNELRNDYSNPYFYCLFRKDTSYHLVRGCSNGALTKSEVRLEFDHPPVALDISSSPVKLHMDTVFHVVEGGNFSYALRINPEMDKELSMHYLRCYNLSEHAQIDTCRPSIRPGYCPVTRSSHRMKGFPFKFSKIIDMITLEQEKPIKFNLILILEPDWINLITIIKNNGKGEYLFYEIIKQKITLPSANIKFSYEGEHFRYFVEGSKEVHNLFEFSLPCIILNTDYCFIFEEELKCRYDNSTQLCIKSDKQSGIRNIDTDEISFTIQPLVSSSMEKRRITIYGAKPIFHDWIAQRYDLKIAIIMTPNDFIEPENFSSNFQEFQLSFKPLKVPKPNTSITIKLGFVLRRLNKTVTTAKHQTIFLTDPSIIEIVPDYVFPRLKNARFLVKLLSIPSDLNKLSFRLNNSKDFIKETHKIVNSSENIINQTIKLEHVFISPTKVPIQLIFGGKVYGKRDLTVMKMPTLPENLNIVIFSEAEFSLTWNGTGFEAFKDPAIGVTNNTSPKSVYSTCYVQNYVTCAYPKLSQIKVKHRTTLFFYSHSGRIELLSNQVTYLPAPSNFYAYTAENYVRLSADNLHHTYPAEVSLMKIGGQQKLECSSLKNKTINVAQGLVDIICFLNESLYNSTDWMLNLKIGNWSVSSINVKLIPRPIEDPSSLKPILFKTMLAIISFIGLIFVFIIAKKFMVRSKLRILINAKKLRLQFNAANLKKKASSKSGNNVKLKKAELFDTFQQTETTGGSLKPMNTTTTRTTVTTMKTAISAFSPKPVNEQRKKKVTSS